MNQLISWFNANKLTLNVDKSSFTIFKCRGNRIQNLPSHIEFQGYQIKRSTHIKFLGIIIEENLTWNLHINELCNKLKRLFHIFYNIRDFLSKENKKTIYYTLIYSRIKYGITLFGHAGPTKLKKIQTLQNQLLKVLLRKDYRFSTNELHKSMDLLKINDIADQEILSFVHNYFSKKLPPVFDDYYSTLAEQHQIDTRNGQNLLYIPNHVTNIAATSLKISGAKLWNHLVNNLKKIPKVKSFRKMLKTKIVSSYIVNPQN